MRVWRRGRRRRQILGLTTNRSPFPDTSHAIARADEVRGQNQKMLGLPRRMNPDGRVTTGELWILVCKRRCLRRLRKELHKQKLFRLECVANLIRAIGRNARIVILY